MKRGITARQFVRALTTDGFTHDRTTGDHRIYRHPDGRIVPVVFKHKGSHTFPVGTLRKMVQLARWTDDDLRRHDFL